MSTPTYGAPHYAAVVEGLVPFSTVGVWSVALDYVSVDSTNKDLISIINSLKATHGIFIDSETSPNVCFIRNTSINDHVLQITYTGDTPLSEKKSFLNTSYAMRYNDGKTLEFAIGGFNAATVWVYPGAQEYISYKDVDLQKTHAIGNAYVLELDGVRYTDTREHVIGGYLSYGSIESIIEVNELGDILDFISQMAIGGNYHNKQLVNKDDKPHTVKVYVDKNKPIGNTNLKAGTMQEVYSGKAIYCNTDKYVGAPVFGSVNNRKVDANGISMTLAPMYLPGLSNEHTYSDPIDSRFETIVTLTGTVSQTTGVINYAKELPPVDIIVKIGDDPHWPEVTVENGVTTWSLTLTSKQFAHVDSYTVSASRLGGVNAYHVSNLVLEPIIYKHFTLYDDVAGPLNHVNKVVDKESITLSLKTLGITDASVISYATGTKSGSIPNTHGISVDGDVLTIKTFYGTYNTGSTGLINNTIGELVLVNNGGVPAINLISNVDTSKQTPLYNTEFMDYAYVAVKGLGKEVFTLDMFSTTNSGHCVYLADQDVNLWLLRI